MHRWKKLMGAVNAMALMLVAVSANSACIVWFHQPEFPEEARKFRRIGRQ